MFHGGNAIVGKFRLGNKFSSETSHSPALGGSRINPPMGKSPIVQRVERRLAEIKLGPIEAAERVEGLGRDFINDLIKGKKRSFNSDKQKLVAKALHWTVAELIGEASDRDPDRELTEDDKPFADALPQMVGRIGGGSTGTIITIEGNMSSREAVSDWWRIPPAVLRGLAKTDVNRTVGFAMDGDSMEPTIQRTDIVFIDTARRRIEPDGIWAIDYGLGRTLKRITVRKVNGEARFIIKSDNKAYPDEEYTESEVTIFGRYIGRFSVF